MKKASLILLSAALLFAASPDVGKTGMDPELVAKIAPRIKTFVDRGTIAGAVMLVQRHGAVAALEAVGYQDMEAKKPMRTDTIFQIMSMTKPVTATGIMILAEEGKLTLSDPVEKHLPEFRGMWLVEKKPADGKSLTLKRPSRVITIRDLMTHTSGMTHPPPEGAKEVYQKMEFSLAQAVALFSQQPLDFEPGTKWQYSNSGIATLGRIIEVVADQPYEKFIEERIFRPLGMKDSFYFPPADKIDRIAMVYRWENGKLVRAGSDIYGGDPTKYRRGAKFPAPEFGMYSTASDLAKFYQAMCNGGANGNARILSKAAVEVMTAVHTGSIEPSGHAPGMGYGLAWAVVRDPAGMLQLQSQGTFGHGGAFGTQGWVDPKKDLVGVFLIQRVGLNDGAESKAFMNMSAAAIVK
ncbi:MAG: serine hydrolase domain-containing protein [Bryobacteraceae bacterium]